MPSLFPTPSGREWRPPPVLEAPDEGLTRNLYERYWAMASTIAFVPLGEGSFIPGSMTRSGGEKPGGMTAPGQAGPTVSAVAVVG